ncbi:MAG: methylenetetrahydrofolate reductase [Thermoplasmataceae archaeon]
MEFVPSKFLGNSDMEKLSEKVSGLVDVVTVPENPLGKPGIDPILSLYALSEKMDFIAVPHLTPRDKNSLYLRSQGISAMKLGIRNFFVVYGDPISETQHSKEVRELDVQGTIKEINNSILEFKNLPNGIKINVGAAANPHRDNEIENLNKKSSSGADFFITQAIFNADSMRKDWFYQKKFKVFAGFIPLKKKPQIEIMEKMGIQFSKEIKNRLQNSDNIEMESIKIILEIFDEVKEFVCGIHIMPMGKTDLAKTILESV